MTVRRTWKLFEARVANFFKTTRTPLSGGASRHTESDTLHEALFIEAKLRQKLPIADLFDEVMKKAKKENKVPLLALQKKNRKGWLLVCRPEDVHLISSYAKEYEKLPNEDELPKFSEIIGILKGEINGREF